MSNLCMYNGDDDVVLHYAQCYVTLVSHFALSMRSISSDTLCAASLRASPPIFPQAASSVLTSSSLSGALDALVSAESSKMSSQGASGMYSSLDPSASESEESEENENTDWSLDLKSHRFKKKGNSIQDH